MWKPSTRRHVLEPSARFCRESRVRCLADERVCFSRTNPDPLLFPPCDPPSSSLLRPSGTPLLGGHASAHLQEAGPGRRRGELDYQGVGCTPFLKRQDPGRRAHSAESASPPVAESERLALPIESSHAALFDQLLKSLFGQNTARKNLTIDHALYLQDSFRPIEHSDLPPLGKN